MTRVVWAPQALEDVLAIRTFLSRDAPDYADFLVERIIATVRRLETHPRSGRVVPEIGSPLLRELILGRYRIVYRLRRDAAEILTVFHAARLFPGR